MRGDAASDAIERVDPTQQLGEGLVGRIVGAGRHRSLHDGKKSLPQFGDGGLQPIGAAEIRFARDIDRQRRRRLVLDVDRQRRRIDDGQRPNTFGEGARDRRGETTARVDAVRGAYKARFRQDTVVVTQDACVTV